MRIKLTVSYDGTAYCGFQRQSDKPSVQQTIEEAIYSVTKEKISIVGSGRTDSGVHALGQVCHFDTNSTIPPENFSKALNIVLPPDVKVLKSERVEDTFNACKGAKRKTYCYTFYTADTIMPLYERYALKIDGKVDFKKMKSAAKYLRGTHDFKCFCASGSTAKTTVRTLYKVKVKKENDLIKVYLTGNGFLYNMVRIIAGTLLAIGQNRLDKRVIKEMLDKKDRALGGKTISAKGLCLISVEY